MKSADAMFDFAANIPASDGRLPLASVAGSLIIDSGEEDATFVFRCQDRYVVYSALAGLRPLLFVLDDHHADVYEACLERVSQRLSLIADRTAVLGDLSIPPPLYIAYDPITGRVGSITRTRAALRDAAHRGSLGAGIRTNQVSPLSARLFRGTAGACAREGSPVSWDLERCDAQSALALRFHDKAHYVALLKDKDGTTPAHASTAVLDADAVLSAKDWSDLCTMAGFSPDATSRLHVKSSLDSGGNVAAVVTPHNLREALSAVELEWRAGALGDERARARRVQLTEGKIASSWTLGPLDLDRDLVAAAVARQAETRAAHDVRLLVQERVDPPSGGGGPSIGCSFMIGAGGRIAPICAAQQLFVDPARKKHVGAYLVDGFDHNFFAAPDGIGFRSLCGMFADLGYRGPINFDAVDNGEGQYVGVFDCNPRLTAVFPALAVREALRADGVSCERIFNVDYRGVYRWADIHDRLTALDEARLLYTRHRQKGVLPLPNLANPDGFDVHLVNFSRQEIGQLFAADCLGEARDFDKGSIRGVFG